MRVCYILDYCAAGYGRPENVLYLARSMQKQGHEVLVLVGEGDPTLLEGIEGHVLRRCGPRVGRFSNRVIYGKESLAYRSFLTRHLDRWNPDLVEIYETADIWALSDWKGSPKVLSLRTDPRDYDNRRRDLVCSTLSRMDWVEYRTPDAREWLIQYGAADSRLSWGCSGIIEPCSGEEPLVLSGNPSLVCAARIDKNKNQRSLIEALPGILAKHPGAHLSLIGDGPDRDYCQRLAQQLGVEYRVSFLGHMAHSWQRLSGANLHLLISHSEGYPRSIMESMLLGVPVACSAPASGPILGNELGALLDHDRPDVLAEQISQVLSEPRLMRQRANDAQIHAREHYVFDAQVRRSLHIYNTVLTGS